MAAFSTGVESSRAALVADLDYYAVARGLIRTSRDFCLGSVFIVDLTPARDPDLLVDSLLIDLQTAHWRGVDTRLLVGGSRTTHAITRVSHVAFARAHELGIPCRWLTNYPDVRGSHVKMLLADDRILTGSHNWSPGAFGEQTQDSVLVTSSSLSSYLRSIFERQWQRAEPSGDLA